MMTIVHAQLEQGFEIYLGEMARCATAKCYWALLHLVIIMPDICVALESIRGKAKSEHYMGWCHRYLASPCLSSKEWYEICYLILHQGRTKRLKGRYAGYSFQQPESYSTAIHRHLVGGILHLDVHELTREMREAMNRWFEEIETNIYPNCSQNVARNISSLVRLYPSVLPAPQPSFIQVYNVTSSP
jgi:hypothetical protein